MHSNLTLATRHQSQGAHLPREIMYYIHSQWNITCKILQSNMETSVLKSADLRARFRPYGLPNKDLALHAQCPIFQRDKQHPPGQVLSFVSFVLDPLQR